MAVTAQEIAELCGVSRATVYRALNNVGRINPETKEKILKTAEKYHYSPNGLARGLVMGRSSFIGLVTVSITNPYFAQMATHLEEEAIKRNYYITLSFHDNSASREEQMILRMKDIPVEGLIIDSIGVEPRYTDLLRNLGIPVVMLDNIGMEYWPTVSIDEHQAVYDVTQMAIERGYTRLVLICPPLSEKEMNVQAHYDRRDGFLDAVSKHQNVESVILGDSHFAEHLTEQISEEKRTAFICCADIWAEEAIGVLWNRGFMLKKDYGISGFDNINKLTNGPAGFTSVEKNMQDEASAAIRILCSQIQEKQAGGHPKTGYEHYLSTYRIIDRGTL